MHTTTKLEIFDEQISFVHNNLRRFLNIQEVLKRVLDIRWFLHLNFRNKKCPDSHFNIFQCNMSTYPL